MRALAERYQELGFRVIEGRGGESRIVLKTPGLAWAFGQQHKNVLRDISKQREKILGSNLSRRFDQHCCVSTYRARDGKDQPCFELTETGVLLVAAKYDEQIGVLLPFLFEALTSGDEADADNLVEQIKSRLKAIRSKAKQGELDLSIVREPVQRAIRDHNARHTDALAGDVDRRGWGAWAGAEVVEVVADNPYIGERSPPVLWGKPLIKHNAHHFEDANGRPFFSKRFDDETGRMVEFWLHWDKAKSTQKHEVYLSDGVGQVLFRYDESVTPMVASRLCERECGAPLALIEAIINYLLNLT